MRLKVTRESPLEEIRAQMLGDPYLRASYLAAYRDLLTRADACPRADLPVIELGGGAGHRQGD